MANKVDELIMAIAGDITVKDDQGQPTLANDCRAERTLLALLTAYQLG